MPATLVRRRAHRSAARSARHRVWRERARRAHRGQHARAAARARAQRERARSATTARAARRRVGRPDRRWRSRLALRRRQLSQRRLPPQYLPASRRHQWLRRDQRAAASCTGSRSSTLRVDVTAMWVDLDNGYDAFSIDNSRITQSDKPGQDAQLSRAARGAPRLRAVPSLRRHQPHGLRQLAQRLLVRRRLGQRRELGCEFALRLFPALRSRPAHAERGSAPRVARIGGRWRRASPGSRASTCCAPTKTCSSTTSGAICVNGDGDSRFASDYRATNLAGLRRARMAAWRERPCSRSVRARRTPRADYADSNGAAFSPDETMFGGSLEPAPCFRRAAQRLRDAGARLQGRRLQHRRRRAAGEAQLRRRNPAQPRARLPRGERRRRR